ALSPTANTITEPQANNSLPQRQQALKPFLAKHIRVHRRGGDNHNHSKPTIQK
ncbi:hypothetical protein A2U01_0117601, partial [Trifolium medium]|nr:hypothetical protein [Trifolium medium]